MTGLGTGDADAGLQPVLAPEPPPDPPTDPPAPRPARPRNPRLKTAKPVLLASVILIQVVSSTFFVFKILADIFVWRSPVLVPWEYLELLEILASIGMVFGIVSSVVLLRLSLKRVRRVEAQLQAAAGQVQSYVEAQFHAWNLTGTEREVALLVVKGFSNAEISRYRGTTESTTKSQVSSIFRKSGLSSRQQLISLMVEDLFEAFQI